MDTLSYILTSLLSLIGGGGIATLFTLKSSRRKGDAEADSTVIDNFKELINTMRLYYEGKVEELEKLKCYRFDCGTRIPPINTQEHEEK